MKTANVVLCITAFVVLAANSANANLIRNPGFGLGESSWGTNAITNVGAWSGSSGSCAYVPSMSAGTGQVWQYIPSWKLPSGNVQLQYWDERKKWFGQNNRATINIYSLKTPTARSGGPAPGGVLGTDYSILAGAGNLVMGNGFWWPSSAFKWTVGDGLNGFASRGNCPQGLLLSVSWYGGGTYGAGFDNFVLQAGSRGLCAGDPILGAPTGTPHQFSTNLSMGYSGAGIDSPIWIDPEWAVAYEYEMTGPKRFSSSLKGIELVPLGDGLYDIDIWDTGAGDWAEVGSDVGAGLVYFATIAPGKVVRKFRIRGIETSAEIDPDGHGFPIGVMFNNGGWDQEITMTALVPEPATLGLLAFGGLVVLKRRRR